jgi:hypothetical protein
LNPGGQAHKVEFNATPRPMTMFVANVEHVATKRRLHVDVISHVVIISHFAGCKHIDQQ